MNPELLSELKNPLIRQAVELALAKDSPKKLLSAFTFSITEEGHDYWSVVSKARTLPPEARAKLEAMLKATKPRRGFANMDPERLRKLAAAGGKSVPDRKRSFSLDPELARRAGSKGGKAVRAETRTFSRDHELAREVGRKGGLASSNKGKPHAKSS